MCRLFVDCQTSWVIRGSIQRFLVWYCLCRVRWFVLAKFKANEYIPFAMPLVAHEQYQFFLCCREWFYFLTLMCDHSNESY